MAESVLNAAPGIEQNIFMREMQLGRFTILEVGGQDIGQIMRVNHYVFDARRIELVERAVDQAASVDLGQRFGPCIGIGAQALAVTGGQDEGFCWNHVMKPG